jgi:hypothetical protein
MMPFQYDGFISGKQLISKKKGRVWRPLDFPLHTGFPEDASGMSVHQNFFTCRAHCHTAIVPGELAMQ